MFRRANLRLVECLDILIFILQLEILQIFPRSRTAVFGFVTQNNKDNKL